MELDSLIEALLFWKGEPLSLPKLATVFNQKEVEIEKSLDILRDKLASRGVKLLVKDGEATLGTAPEASEMISALTKEELDHDLGKAGLETMSIILYRGPLSRADIDYLRGVNSSFILRHLLIRGLVERIPNPDDSRSFLYRPTFDTLQYLGVTKVNELPEYDSQSI